MSEGASGRRLRIAHLTATFPPYPGGAGNTAFRFAREQADRGHEVEVFTAPAPGAAPDPGDVVVHRIDPVFAIGNAPLIPSLARIDGFDVVHLHYPFIFGSELTLLARLRRSARRQALLVHYKNRLVGKGALASVEVKPDVYDAFNRETEQRLESSVWNAGGCASWYLDENGRNCVWWPDFMAKLWQRTRRFDRGSYRAELPV